MALSVPRRYFLKLSSLNFNGGDQTLIHFLEDVPFHYCTKPCAMARQDYGIARHKREDKKAKVR